MFKSERWMQGKFINLWNRFVCCNKCILDDANVVAYDVLVCGNNSF